MKTKRKNIINELNELNANSLLNLKKDQVNVPNTLENDILNFIHENDNEDTKTVSFPKMLIAMSGLAASIIIGLLTLNIYFNTSQVNNDIALQMEELSEEELLFYIEDNLTYFTEEELIALVNDDTENFFDNSGISEEYLEEYFY